MSRKTEMATEKGQWLRRGYGHDHGQVHGHGHENGHGHGQSRVRDSQEHGLDQVHGHGYGAARSWSRHDHGRNTENLQNRNYDCKSLNLLNYFLHHQL